MELQNQLRDGATVYGADGDKVGTMRTHGGNYIVVEKGFFFPTDYYIPVSAIETATDGEVYLNVGKDEALNQGWDIEPTDNLQTAPHIRDDDPAYTGGAYDETAHRSDAAGTGAYQTNAPGTMASQDDTAGASARNWADTSTGEMVQDQVAGEGVMRVPVHEERLEPTKHTEQSGEVQISKRVVTDQETIEVPVSEERIRVDWRATADDGTAVESDFQESSIEVPVSREVVDVNKRTVKTGELEVSRDLDEHTEKVTESVRREVVEVDDSKARTTSKSRKSNRR
jgi:uncharacterized protein (TIGR02271 family)